MDNRILVPIRYAAWLSGDLGKRIQEAFQNGLAHIDAHVTRLPRGLLVEADEDPGPLVEAVHYAAAEVEAGVQEAYPIFYREMGPIWTGTLQVLFSPAIYAPPCS